MIAKTIVSLVLLSLPALALAEAPSTQSIGNGGRPASIAPDLHLPVLHPLKPARPLDVLKTAPLYTFSELDVDAYVKYLSASEPDPLKRVVQLARKNIGEPYEIYLLGEGPYETYDPDPMYCLDRSDCVTFVEHTYSMALSHDWETFFKTLQRLRYKDGKVGMLTRNHETSADWDPNNAWLFDDITEKLGGKEATHPMHLIWKPSKFFAKFGIGQDKQDVTVDSSYVPRDKVQSILTQLKDGDIVHVVRGNDSDQYIGHFGMIAHSDNGEVHMIHSSNPAVREQPIMDYLQRNRNTLGFKFLRMKENGQQIAAAEVK